MTKDELRALQTPLKEKYRQDAAAAQTTIRVTGELDLPRLVCKIETAAALSPRRGCTRWPAAIRNWPARRTCYWKR